MIGLNTIYNEDCISGMERIPDASVDCILTDPPYKYLKNQKLEVDFDERAFFNKCKRVLKKDGMIVLFGRGTSFYRWNAILADMGFNFKEEIVWDKSYCTSPLMAVSRVHETISIYTKGKGVLNRIKVPYLEIKAHDLGSVIGDVKRMRNILNNTKSLNYVLEYLENNIIHNTDRKKTGVSISSEICSPDRSASVMKCICDGMNEKTIIKQPREHYSTIHPTQKPIRLLERLLALVTKEGNVVLDPFSGSGSTAAACINCGRQYIGFEIDKEYYDLSSERIENMRSAPTLFDQSIMPMAGETI